MISHRISWYSMSNTHMGLIPNARRATRKAFQIFVFSLLSFGFFCFQTSMIIPHVYLLIFLWDKFFSNQLGLEVLKGIIFSCEMARYFLPVKIYKKVFTDESPMKVFAEFSVQNHSEPCVYNRAFQLFFSFTYFYSDTWSATKPS